MGRSRGASQQQPDLYAFWVNAGLLRGTLESDAPAHVERYAVVGASAWIETVPGAAPRHLDEPA